MTTAAADEHAAPADAAAPAGPLAPAAPVASVALAEPLEARWVRFVPVALAILAAVLYGWNLTVSGYANTYYSAAAQAGAQSWTAMLFGSLDAQNFITVDKPPVALWPMGLSVRLFGLSPFAVLLPQVLAGVGSVLLLYAAVHRQLGTGAALIAGVAFALTPVATLMFRYNNPDAVLVLLLVAAAYAVVRGLDTDHLRWPVLAGVLVGFAFLTKFLQAYLVLPAFGLVWLVAARGGLGRRIAVLVAAGVAVAVSSFWWVALMELLPAGSRPFIGGSETNSVVDLLLGYDGLGRIFGGRGGGPGGGGGGPGGGLFGGQPGILRMFNDQWAGEVSWLLPGAAIGLVVGVVARIRAGRTDRRLAAYLLWGTWAVVHVLVFSLMSGIAHPYYAVALAPALAALFGGGVVELWRLRARFPWAGLGIAAMLVVTAWWSLQVLERTPDYFPGVGLGALFVVIAASLVVSVPPVEGDERASRIAHGALTVGLAAALVGPTLYTVTTMDKAIAGGDPAAGPNTGAFGRPGGFGSFGGPGFVGDNGGTNRALVTYLLDNHGEESWLVAVSSANQAGPLQLASGVPVMAMGGFTGGDPAPTLEQLQGWIREGRLRYVMIGGRDGGPGGFFGGDGVGNVAGARSQWVEAACKPITVGGINATLFDCAGAAG